MTDEERAELEALRSEVALLRRVADAAAFASIDIASNLSSAHKEYMRGDIARGAYDYVLMRQSSLLIALRQAGYTEKHRLFEFPVKPESGAGQTRLENAAPVAAVSSAS